VEREKKKKSEEKKGENKNGSGCACCRVYVAGIASVLIAGQAGFSKVKYYS